MLRTNSNFNESHLQKKTNNGLSERIVRIRVKKR